MLQDILILWVGSVKLRGQEDYASWFVTCRTLQALIFGRLERIATKLRLQSTEYQASSIECMKLQR